MGKSQANRGMKLEKMIEEQCKKYEKEKKAIIRKTPTDWVVQRAGAKIVSAFPKKKSTVDFIGDWQGRSIAIETKGTKLKTSFPFSNLHEHQIEIIDNWGGLAYYIVYFESLKRLFLCEGKYFQNEMRAIDRKSFPLSWFEESESVIEMEDTDFLKYFPEN